MSINENNWVRRGMDIYVKESRPQGKQRKTWINVVEEDIRLKWRGREDTND